MAKITVGKIVDVALALGTEAGKQIADFITYMGQFAEQVSRVLTKQVTITDNIDGTFLLVELYHNTAQVVNTGGRIPAWLSVARVVSTSVGVDALTWYVDEQSRVTVKIAFTGAPSAKQTVSLVVIYA